MRRTDTSNSPPLAVREAIINAVAHDDYAQRGGPIRISIFDDRVEIENPGLFPFGVTIEDLMQGISKLRNRVFARVLHELKLIETWGSGIQRMVSTCREAGLPPPEMLEIGSRFRVTIGTVQAAAPIVDALEQTILTLLERRPGVSTQEIAHAIDRTPRATRSRMLRLVERGLVYEIASSVQEPNRKYFLARN